MAHGNDEYVSWGPLGDVPKHYFKIWGYLTILFLVSFFGAMLGRDVIGGEAGFYMVLLTAFGIAFWKAYLVVSEFMHLPLEKKYIFYIQATCLAFMLLFFFGVAPDVMRHEGTNWTNTAAIEAIERGWAKGSGDHGHGDAHDAKAGDAHGEGAHGEDEAGNH